MFSNIKNSYILSRTHYLVKRQHKALHTTIKLNENNLTIDDRVEWIVLNIPENLFYFIYTLIYVG